MSTHVATAHVGTLLLSAVTTAALGAVACRNRETPGATAFCGLMAAVTVWTTGYLVGLTVAPGGRLLWEPIQWIGIAFVPVAFLAFAMDYLGHEESLRRVVAVASLPAVATLVGVWTNPYHHLVWREQVVHEVAGLRIVGQVAGPGYLAFVIYAYALVVVGSYLLGRLAVRSDYLYLDQSILLLVGVAVPLVGNAVSVFARTPIPGIDLTPYAFTITGIAFGNALFRYSLFERVPAAWQLGQETVVGSLDDAVVIVDSDRTVLYCNDEATEVFGVDVSEAVGEDVRDVVAADDVDFDAPGALGELDLGGRTYEVRSSEIVDRHDRSLGYTLVFNDITERKRRERTLQRQRDELRLLDRLNAVIRGVNGALIGASTRAEISETVCDRLADSALYDAAWTLDETSLDAAALPGDREREPGTGTRTGTRTGTGPGPGSGGASGPETDGGTVVEGDLATGRSGLAVHTDAASVPVSDEAAPDASGVWTTVPLVYGRTVYGTLVLFTQRADAFGERELAVLDELGRSIGHAINAVEKEQLLLSGAVVELEFVSREDVLAVAAAAADCSLAVKGLAPRADRLVAYCRIETGDVARLVDALAAEEAVVDATPVEGDRTLVACRLDGGSVVFPLRERGASFQDARASDGRLTVEVQVAPDVDVRTVVDRVQEDFPEADLRAKRERREPGEGPDAVPEDVLDELTDRQQEALRTAFHDGYFEWPRESSAEDVADAMDISSPTLHNHLRKAENKLLAEILADESRSLGDGTDPFDDEVES